jgi:hypothetical protein
MKPTWSGWPAVIAAQNEDVNSYGPLYQGRWNGDDRNWIPQVYDTMVQWDTEGPSIHVEVEMDMGLTYTNEVGVLWTPIPGEQTTWQPVPYPL